MFLDVFDKSLNRVGRIYTWVSLVWEPQYNTNGKFQLELQPAKGIKELFREDYYCSVDESDTLMVIKSVEIDKTAVINGFDATHILDERVFTDAVKAGNAEQMMRSIVAKYCSDWPCLELGNLAGIPDAYNHDISDGSALEKIQTIAQACDIGIRIRKDGKKLLFECYKPAQNPNLKFAERYGNLNNVTYAKSTIQYKNVAIVAGQGKGEERVTVIVGDTNSKGADRREMYVDARNVQQEDDETDAQYIERLKAVGIEKLLERKAIELVNVSVTGRVSLGDVVTVMADDYGVTLSARVTSITITSQDNITQREVGIGTPISITKRS